MTHQGGCQCGVLNYAYAADQLPLTYACHCRDCQTASGSSFALQAFVVADRLTVEGDTASWSAGEGRSTIAHCATCMTRIYSTHPAAPGFAILRAGTLDESDRLVPSFHIWAKRAQPWIVLADDVPQFAENVAPDEAMALLAANLA